MTQDELVQAFFDAYEPFNMNFVCEREGLDPDKVWAAIEVIRDAEFIAACNKQSDADYMECIPF